MRISEITLVVEYFRLHAVLTFELWLVKILACLRNVAILHSDSCNNIYPPSLILSVCRHTYSFFLCIVRAIISIDVEAMKHRHTATLLRILTPGLKKLNSPQAGTHILLSSSKKKFSEQTGSASDELSFPRSVFKISVSEFGGVTVDDEFTIKKAKLHTLLANNYLV